MIERYLAAVSSYAADIDGLILLVTVIVGFWFVLVEGVFFTFLWRFRRKPGVKADYITGEEHEYTRWGMKRFIERDALDVLQPDIYWCGGLSETLKIAAYASVHDLITIPHGHSTPANPHFSVTQSPIHTPYQEFLVKWNEIHQHFLANPITPEGGMLRAPETPGLGMDLDEAKIESEETLVL